MQTKFHTVINRLYYILVLLTPWIMYSGTSELFEFNKMMFIYIITVLIGVCWVIDFTRHRKRIRHYWPITFFMGLFLVSQLLSTFFSIDIHTSLFGYYGRFNGGLYSIITYMVLSFGLLQYFDRTSIKKLLLFSLFSSVIVMLWGLPGRYGHDLSCLVFTGSFSSACWTDQFRPAERMFSTLGQPNWLGSYMAIHFFIGVYFVISASLKRHFLRSYGYVAYSLFVFCTILFTRSRSSLAAVGIGVVFLPGLFLILKSHKHIDRSFMKLIGVFIVAIGVVALIIKTGIPQIDSRITLSKSGSVSKTDNIDVPSTPPVGGVTDSLDIRKIVWKGAAELGRRYPLFGTGVETFAYSYYFVRPQEHNLTSEWDFLYNKAHNEFLNYFATSGYIGLITYSLMILSTFIIVVKVLLSKIKSDSADRFDDKILAYCLGLSYVTIQVTNFFGFSTTSVQLFFYLIPPALLLLRPARTSEETPEKHSGSIISNIVTGGSLAVGVFLIISLVNMYRADLMYADSDRLVRAGDYQAAASVYSDILSLHYEHVYEDKLSYILANLAYSVSKAGDEKTSERLLKLSKYYNGHSLQVSHDNILYLKTAVKNAYLYYQIHQETDRLLEAMPIFETANRIAPTDPKIPYSQALFYSLLEDEEVEKESKTIFAEQSLNTINRAITLKPDYYDAYFLKAQLLRKYGLKNEAKQVYEHMLDTFGKNNEEVLKELGSL